MKILLKHLQLDFPQFNFVPNQKFHFHPPKNIYYTNKNNYTNNELKLLLLHETSHALLHHHDYDSAVDLLQMETAAWQKAKDLAKKYHISWNEDFKDDRLDSYRDYLHKKSTCPRCNLNGYYSKNDHLFHCPNCQKTWQ